MEYVSVTGAAGYLGSVLCEHLLDSGFHVLAVDRMVFEPSLFHLCAHPNFDFLPGDVRDRSILEQALKKADIIIPLAAVVGAPACEKDPWTARTVNFEAIALLDRLRSRQQLVVYPNTNSGYGTQNSACPCSEDTPLEPISLYAQTKASAEAALLASGNAIALRLATVFGMSPRMRLDLLVNHFVWEAVTQGYIVLFEAHYKRNYVHIRDVADCFIHAIRNRETMAGLPFNVGLDEANLSKAELAAAIQSHIPEFLVYCSEIGSDPDKRNYVISNERLRQTGFGAQRRIDDGIIELLKGYKMLGRRQFCNV